MGKLYMREVRCWGGGTAVLEDEDEDIARGYRGPRSSDICVTFEALLNIKC
jgi:hypothetical protein